MDLIPESDRNLLRNHDADKAAVKYPELFFDLIFVFVFTRITEFLVHHHDVLGFVQGIMLIMAIWWVWVFTSWATNWLDPDKMPVRLLLLALTLGGLILSVSLPESFGDTGLLFAVAYAAMHVSRSVFMLYALERHNKKNHRNFQRITFWLCVSAVFWIAGGFAEGTMRIGLWVTALAIEYAGPACSFRTPYLGKSTTKDWDVEGAHMSERCALFVIIALGESILVTGRTFAELEWTGQLWAAFLAAFANCAVLWWIYFDTGVHRGKDEIDHAADPGRLARLSYTYIHLPIIVGVIVSAVGSEMLLEHPSHSAGGTIALMMIGGAMAFLAGNLLFKRSIGNRMPRSHITGIILLLILVYPAMYMNALILSVAVTGALLIVALWETIAIRKNICE